MQSIRYTYRCVSCVKFYARSWRFLRCVRCVRLETGLEVDIVIDQTKDRPAMRAVE